VPRPAAPAPGPPRLALALQGLRHLAQARAAPPDEQVLRDEAQAGILRAIGDLPEVQRLVVVLRYYHDLRLAEIAQILQVSERTVNKRLYSAHKRLRVLLDGKAGDG
jgi:RNA polymerase sigma-70 factor (ECF subfamily)